MSYYFFRRPILILLALLSVAASVRAATIHIKWDPSITGSHFRLIPHKVDFSKAEVSAVDLTQDRHEDFTADLPDGHYRLFGTGFNANLQSLDGKIIFKEESIHPSINHHQGHVSFNTATLNIDLNDYELDVAIEGVVTVLDKATRLHTVKVICGNHQLNYGGGTLTVAVDAQGTVRLPNNPGGFALKGNTITLQPREYLVEHAPNVNRWGLGRNQTFPAGPQTVKLLPTAGRYPLTISATGEKHPRFFLRVNRSYQVSTTIDGEYAEYMEIASDGTGAPVLSLGLPGGKQKVMDRRAAQAVARLAYQTVDRDSLACWHQDFQFHDAMHVFPFPEGLLSYRVKFPEGKIRAAELALLALNDQTAATLRLQLSDIIETDGFLVEATVQFRGNLPLGKTRLYRLTAGYQTPAIDPLPVPIRLDKVSEHVANLSTDCLQIRVPAGRRDFQPGQPLAQVPAPILGLTRIGGAAEPALTSTFVAPDALTVESMSSSLLETGPLLARYRTSYQLAGNKSYEVTLTFRTAESYITVEENLAGFRPADEAYWRTRFASLRPTLRQVMSNGGYKKYSGSYDNGIGPDGRLPVTLGLFTPNSLGVMRSAAFWNDNGPDALLVSLNRIRDWKTDERAVWSGGGPGMLQFFDQDKEQYFQARLQGTARHWALGLIDRNNMLNRPAVEVPGRQSRSAGPEVRLWQKLSDFSLNAWKDRAFDFDETLDPGPFVDKKEVTYEQWIRSYGNVAKGVANQFWDSDNLGAVTYRGMPTWFGTYARSRANWTPEQRHHVRAILLLYAYCSEDDNGFPHHSMLAGHPNFISDVKLTIALACATFPHHPDAKRWRDSFVDYFTEWLDTFQRSADPEHNALGGRWTESIACYSGQSLVGLLESHKALAAYDGTDLINSNPRVADWVRWYRNAIMSPHDGQRLVPPQGAHSRAFEPDNRSHFHDTLFEVAALLAKSDPQLAAEMLWIKTNGKDGTNPQATSCLYVDYGPIFHYDCGGANESYATMQNITGRFNYRWRSAGIVYYGAKGQAWSSHGAEDNGDDFSWDEVSGFSINDQGLQPSPTNQLLYDFDFALFYRARGEAPYLSRSLMLLRNDYLALYDEVSPGAPEGQFIWSSNFQMPQIYQLKPGVTAIQTTSREATPPANHVNAPRPRTAEQRKYIGTGDFLTVVAPTPVQAQAKTYGATVNGEYVLLSPQPIQVDESGLRFRGTAAYARPYQLALFEGTLLALHGMAIQRDGGDFGLSAVIDKDRIIGRFVGRSGGKVFVVPPAGLSPAHASVTVNGKPVPHTVEQDAVAFLVDIAQSDGLKHYEIQFGR